MASQGFPVVFDGAKYDLKRFMHDHPGGINSLISFKNSSVRNVMQKFGHSVGAYHMLKDFKVSAESSEVFTNRDVRLKDSNLTGSVSENGRIITREEVDKDAQEIAFLEELESRLDWSDPLLSQLDAIAPHYELWVHSAVYRNCRLFASPLLESLTFTPWYLVPVFWVPIILYLGCSQFLEHVACGETCPPTSLTVTQYVYNLAVGGLLWTALEYSLHRWVFHLDPGCSMTMIRLHFLIHGIHHKMPFDGLRQVFPPVPAFVLTCIIYVPIYLLLSYPLTKLTGGLIGYLTYDMIHYYVHHGSPKDGTYLYAMKRYHSNHHFVNHNKAFHPELLLERYSEGAEALVEQASRSRGVGTGVPNAADSPYAKLISHTWFYQECRFTHDVSFTVLGSAVKYGITFSRHVCK